MAEETFGKGLPDKCKEDIELRIELSSSFR